MRKRKCRRNNANVFEVSWHYRRRKRKRRRKACFSPILAHERGLTGSKIRQTKMCFRFLGFLL